MADPLTWAAIGTAASIAGGVTSAGGALAKGSADSSMYGYQSGVAKMNADIAQQNAAYSVEAGGSAAYQSGVKTGEIVGQQKANQGASGVDVNSGSPAGIRSTTTALGQIDQNTIRTNYAKRAYGYEVEAASKDAESTADLVAGSNAQKAGFISAAGSILGTVGSVSGKWLQASSAFGGASQGITTYDENMQPSGWQA